MSITCDALPLPSRRPLADRLTHAASRWIHVFMAALFVATALWGFIPSSLAMLEAAGNGRRPPLPFALHAHAVLTGSWLLLLLAQSVLAATGRRSMHRALGLAALALVPAMLAAMAASIPQWWDVTLARVPPQFVPAARNFLANVLFEQFRMGSLILVFLGWALLVRRSDPESHKRLMILATLMLMSAPMDRIVGGLGFTAPAAASSYDAGYLLLLLWLLPALACDTLRLGRPHRAYVLGIAVVLPFAIASHLLWNEPWWTEFAARLAGHGY